MDSDGPLRIRVHEHGGAALVQPSGVLDIATYAQLRDALLRAAADEPSAVVVDVGELAVASADSLTVFSTVSMLLSEWPGVPLLLLAAEPARHAQLVRGPVADLVPVHPDLEAALRTVGHPPQRRRERLTLPGIAVSSALARQFVRQLCRRWGITSMTEDAAAVATELIENVIQHTASAAELRLGLRRGLLSVAVSDRDPHPAVLREAVSRAMPSAGLAIVAQLAGAWGCTPTVNGKIVWAVLKVS